MISAGQPVQDAVPGAGDRDTPVVSVCIPVYNREGMVQNAIDSALSQALPGMEIIVVDNASSDGTWAVISSYPPPVRAFRNPVNVGPRSNVNRCLELARGRYIRLLMSDDRLTPGSLAREVALLDAQPELAMASSPGVRLVDGRATRKREGDHLRPGVYPSGEDTIVNLLWILATYGYNPLNLPSGILLRRKFCRQIGELEAVACGCCDVDYWLRLLRLGGLAILAAPSCEIGIHPATDSNRELLSGDLMRGRYALSRRYAPEIRRRDLDGVVLAHLDACSLWFGMKQLAHLQIRSAVRYFLMPRELGSGYRRAVRALAVGATYRIRRQFWGTRLSLQAPCARATSAVVVQ